MYDLKTVIIEDEMSSQNLLKSIVNDYCIGLDLVGVASNVETGISLINNQDTDLVFLDIDLGQHNAFELLDHFKDRKFKVIFTTAHEEYAVKAFKYEAVDYILKPYSPKDVLQSVERIKDKFQEKQMLRNLENAVKRNGSSNHSPKKITIPTAEGIMVYKLDKIMRFEGSGSYSYLYRKDEKKVLISKSLKEIESMIPGDIFFRSHDSHLVNLSHVKEFRKEDGGMIVLENEDQVPVSRRRKQEFLDNLVGLGDPG